MGDLGGLQGFQDGAQHLVDVVHHLAIEETQHTISLLLEEGGAIGVVCLLIQVLAAIHFDDEFFARLAKIYDVRTNSMLPAEADTYQPVGAQISPQFALRRGEIVAQLGGALHGLWIRSSGFHLKAPPCPPHFLPENGEGGRRPGGAVRSPALHNADLLFGQPVHCIHLPVDLGVDPGDAVL